MVPRSWSEPAAPLGALSALRVSGRSAKGNISRGSQLFAGLLPTRLALLPVRPVGELGIGIGCLSWTTCSAVTARQVVRRMPPHLEEVDCASTVSMGSLFNHFNSLVSTSINTLTPLCNDSAVYSSDTQPQSPKDTDQDQYPAAARVPGNRTNKVDNARPPRAAASSSKPPRAPGRSSIRNRKAGLSVSIPKFPANPHEAPPVSGPGRIASPRNIELRRKNLSERHFFRPVSEDSQDNSYS